LWQQVERLIDKKTKRWMALMNFGARLGCHQMPDRSFSYEGYQFPVCARCTGVIIGELVSIITILCALKISLVYAAVMIVPLVVDGGLQYINIWKSNNLRRIITGIFAGFGLTYEYCCVFKFILHILLDFFAST
jgi:uncharacterized membrane protein